MNVLFLVNTLHQDSEIFYPLLENAVGLFIETDKSRSSDVASLKLILRDILACMRPVSGTRFYYSITPKKDIWELISDFTTLIDDSPNFSDKFKRILYELRNLFLKDIKATKEDRFLREVDIEDSENIEWTDIRDRISSLLLVLPKETKKSTRLEV